MYRKTQKRFYLFWGVGFLLYGLNILMRIGTGPSYSQWFAAFFLLGGFISMIGGIADLVNRISLLYVVLLLPISLLILLVSPYPDSVFIERAGWVIGILPYLIIFVIFLLIQVNFSTALDLLLVGWAVLLLTNIAYAFNAMEPYFVDIMAIFAKIVIFIGMIKPSFSLLVDDLKEFLISGNPTVYVVEENGGVTLISTGVYRNAVLDWIEEKVLDNSRKGIRTILISTYDLISVNDLTSKKIDDKVYFVRMIAGARGSMNIFEENIMQIDDDLNLLELLFTDIIKYSADRKLNCDIILYSISSLIHNYGWRRVYSFLLSNMTQIKASRVRLFLFFVPETHDDPSEIKKFESIADNIVSL
ncbi:MAG: hypothetical protein ABIJ47_05390 [Candidatus Bathyarchaeota archaeon]